MKEQLELTPFEHSEKVRFRHRPYLVLRTNGSCYINKKAARLLNVESGKFIRFFHSTEGHWFIGAANDHENGVELYKSGGLLKFCDQLLVKSLFKTCDLLESKKAFFPVANEIQEVSGRKVLFITPKPFNIG